MSLALTLRRLPGDYGVARLPEGLALDADILRPPFCAISIVDDELTLACPQERIPDDVSTEGPFAAYLVADTGALDAPGVVSALSTPVAAAGLGIFVTSTFTRDVALVKLATEETACAAWRAAGVTIEEGTQP